MGRAVDTEEFAEICLTLKEHGAGNINIVTGSHAAPALALGAALAKKKGLSIPMLWNSSGYEGEETLNLIKDFVDMYLPDLKTLDPSFAAKFFHAPDYPEYAMSTILKMMEYGGYNAVMVRHLVIPGYLEITHQVLSWFSKNFCQGKNGALLSLMTQYTPLVREQGRNSIPNRYVSEDEYKAVLAMLDEFGIDDGFCQELVTGSDWLPDFKRQNPFSSTLSFPIWHWQSGFLQQPAFSS
jgi:putative pyruvate formate lyase activating enzyme